MNASFWQELQAILDQGFTGQIILHCNVGTVVKYEKRETLRPVSEGAAPTVVDCQAAERDYLKRS